MSDLVGNPEDRFSRVAAQISLALIRQLICAVIFIGIAHPLSIAGVLVTRLKTPFL